MASRIAGATTSRPAAARPASRVTARLNHVAHEARLNNVTHDTAPKPCRPKARSNPTVSGDWSMATAAASQQAVKGLDLGTSRIVLATLDGQKVDFSRQLNAFVDIPYTKMTQQ